ncbi:hypothetical protein J4H86_00175 [Spiractinospora alimapuensis]|uniref:hypothetical protein n=1 Tax=Spiractinospora alimapuensis TaxID=2820884 RepID=UPI001F466586|nr:hypothetical protein [Spiractinospora alimapuensis]QVQ52331.1 hypothetical protein J4H86_00175 [Spiractinospora alimapuensis]
MRSGWPTARHRTLSVSLVVVGLLFFVCALCPGVDLAPHDAGTPSPATVATGDERTEGEARPTPVNERGAAHSCEMGEAEGITNPTPPIAAGLGLLPVVGLLVPRPRPLLRPVGSSPVHRFGHRLLRLLCVHRV